MVGRQGGEQVGGRDGEKGRETLEEWKEREKEKCSRGKREIEKRGREENERERDKKRTVWSL